jgi:hypothetical protein
MPIRILPHNQSHFPHEDALATWLLTSLPARGGLYLLGSASAVADLCPGTIVLFRYAHKIVGEAVVAKGKEVYPDEQKPKMLSGETAEARFSVAPSSIRVYSPPLLVEDIQPHTDKNLIQFPGAYVELSDLVYPAILRLVVSAGAFLPV